MLVNKKEFTVVLDNWARIGEVINAVSKKVGGKIQANQSKYVILAS